MKIIGHRGAKGLAPENTIASFEKALEHQVDEIEFDVRISKDGVPVLAHDTEIGTTADNKLRIADSTYAELKAHKPDLTTLAEVIDGFAGKVPLLIEVKQKEPVEAVVTLLKMYLAKGHAPTEFMLGSFNQTTLRQLHRELPEIEKVVIERWSGVKGSLRGRQVNTKRLSMKHLWLWRGFLRSMQRRGWHIAAYTMNDPVKLRKWEPYLYGVITDFPDRFKK